METRKVSARLRAPLPTAIAVAVLILGSWGCAHLRNGRRWGEDAVVPPPSLDRVWHSALRAALHPMTWAPAVGAALFAIDGFDRKVSDWASRHTPVFGSTSAAEDAGNYLLWSAGGAAALTAVATPSGEETGDWLLSKARGLAVEGAGVGATAGVTALLKGAVGRSRPSGSSHSSFPSSHASAAFSFAALASRNLDSISLPPGLRTGLQVGSYAMAGGVAWARVEAGRHYPSDVLAGAAIGNFLTIFIHDAFLGLDFEPKVSVDVDIGPRAAAIGIGIPF